IISAAESQSAGRLTKASQSDIIIGQGVKSQVGQATILVGNQKLLAVHQVDIPQRLSQYVVKRQSAGNTVVLVARDGQAIGAIAIADTVRDGARQTIDRLKARGIRT